jgi:hypothetical protein
MNNVFQNDKMILDVCFSFAFKAIQFLGHKFFWIVILKKKKKNPLKHASSK